MTSHDVARLAGVSQPTVSRALRGTAYVAPATRQRIAAAAEALGYIPSAAGRTLSTRSTRQIAIVADLENPLYPRLVGPIHDALLELGYRMVLFAERGDEMAKYERLLDRSVDAAILTTPQLHSSLPYMLAQKRLPFVQLNRTSDLVDADSVTADNRSGGTQAARLLIESGHTTIGAILGPKETSTSRDREAGLREALDEAGVTLPSRNVHRGDFTYADGCAGFQAIMQRSGAPTAMFCANDVVAVGALNAALDMGLQVPRDVSIVGFDDLDIASWPVFRLSTVKVDFAGMVHRAATVLVQRIRSGPDAPPVHEVFATQLVPRATHAPPPDPARARRGGPRR